MNLYFKLKLIEEVIAIAIAIGMLIFWIIVIKLNGRK